MQTSKLVTLILVLGAAPAASAWAQDADIAAKGEKIFKRCAACHMVGEGAENRVGPEMNGLNGRVAGTLPDFKYSDAMVEAGKGGLVWNDETLFQYLENPKKLVPGTKMAFAGLKSEDDRHAVIAYIDTHGGKE
ncbi:MAG: cytochrome c family protein [Amaricoccus sp.]|uniref:c-type cytochrome n=1 Tax=Amaricoccus sp. TaxID=1872485 RepID=UPI003314B10E